MKYVSPDSDAKIQSAGIYPLGFNVFDRNVDKILVNPFYADILTTSFRAPRKNRGAGFSAAQTRFKQEDATNKRTINAKCATINFKMWQINCTFVANLKTNE